MTGKRILLIVVCVLSLLTVVACDGALLDEEELKKKIIYPLEEIFITGDVDRMADFFADPIILRDAQEKKIGTRSREDFILHVGEKLVETGTLNTYQLLNPRFSIKKTGAIIRATSFYQIKEYGSDRILEGSANVYLHVVKRGETLVITETTVLPW